MDEPINDARNFPPKRDRAEETTPDVERIPVLLPASYVHRRGYEEGVHDALVMVAAMFGLMATIIYLGWRNNGSN